MLDASELTYFGRHNRTEITGGSVDSQIVGDEEVEMLTFRVKCPNRKGKGERHGVARNFQLPIDHPLAEFLLTLVQEEDPR